MSKVDPENPELPPKYARKLDEALEDAEPVGSTDATDGDEGLDAEGIGEQFKDMGHPDNPDKLIR